MAEESRSTPVPTPAREAAGAPPSPVGADLSERKLTIEDDTWTVRSLGEGVTGLPPNAGAPLLLLGFVPEDARAGPAREVLAVARTLDELAAHDLIELFRRSAPAEDGAREGAVNGRRERGVRPRR